MTLNSKMVPPVNASGAQRFTTKGTIFDFTMLHVVWLSWLTGWVVLI